MTTKAIILGAGMGKRMGTDLPKVLHTICDVPMINILLDAVKKTGIEDITVVIGPNMENVKEAVHPVKTVVQTERLGTAHAVLAAESEIGVFEGNVLILFGDQPLFLPETLKKMVEKCESGTDVAILGFIPEDPRRYGRLIMGENGLDAIVEYKDATDVQRAIKLCNSGVMCVNGKHLISLLKEIDNQNAAGEYYLTDIVKKAKNRGLSRDIVIGDAAELHGVNTQEELELAEEIYKKRMSSC